MNFPYIYPSLEWFNKIISVNNREIINFTKEYNSVLRIKRFNEILEKISFQKIKLRQSTKSQKNYDVRWPIAINALGAECNYKLTGNEQSLIALKNLYDCQISQEGNWIKPINSVPQTMKGYSLIYLEQIEKSQLYRKALNNLVKVLLKHERESDGCLSYNTNKNYILVDTLGMICPFLARYSKYYDNPEALELSTNQLKQFVKSNMDIDTHLPYHGYYAEGAKRLGIQGWGRGTGWFMLGLIDTIIEIPEIHPDYSFLVESYLATAHSLKNFQREDGHWSWAILHRKDNLDSSATSFIGYSLLQALKAGILDKSFENVIEKAIQAIVKVTRADGLIDYSLADGLGLGLYPKSFGPQPWLQGMATAFASLYFSDLR